MVYYQPACYAYHHQASCCIWSRAREVICPSCSASHASPAQANLETVLGFELAQEDYEAITAIDFQLRLVDGIRFLRPEGPFRCPSASELHPPMLADWSSQG